MKTNVNHKYNGSSGSILVQTKRLSKAYATAAGEFQALSRINLEVKRGEFLAIQGTSGAGKTTLVNLLTGVDRMTDGEVWIDGVPIHNLKEDELALWRGKNLGIIYQSFYLMPSLSLLDNVLLPMDLCGLFKNGQSKKRALELLEQVELEDHAYKLPSEISGGQQQRVAIARALANDPELIVADEPTGRLDSKTAETIFNVFKELNKRGKTILMVTHDRKLANRLERNITLQDGQILAIEAQTNGKRH